MNEQELKEILRELEEQGWSPLVCDTPVPFYDTAVRCRQPTGAYAVRAESAHGDIHMCTRVRDGRSLRWEQLSSVWV